MSKEELIKAITDLDPTFDRLKIDLNRYTVDQLEFHYKRKLNAPDVVKARWARMKRSGSSTSTTPSVNRGVYYPATPVREVQPQRKKGVTLTGFDALDKQKGKS